MTACLQKHSFLEKHYKIAGAALSFPTEDLTIRQRSQVSQILFPKAICCNHLAIQLIHQWQLDTGQRYNHRTNRLAAGRLGVTAVSPQAWGSLQWQRCGCHPTRFHAPNLPLHICSIAGAVFPMFFNEACLTALLHSGTFYAYREISIDPKSTF